MSSGYLYCFSSSVYKEDVYKLGVTCNLKSRLSSLCSTSITKGEFVLTLPSCRDETKNYCPNSNFPETTIENIFQLEKVLFRLLSAYRIDSSRELFQCKKEIINESFKTLKNLSQAQIQCFLKTGLFDEIENNSVSENESDSKENESFQEINKMSSQQSDREHMDSVETFSCIPCNLEFDSKKALATHLSRSSFHKEIKLDCDFCYKKFSCLAKLNGHLKTCKVFKKQSLKINHEKLTSSIDSLTVELEEQRQAFEDEILSLTEDFNEQLEYQKQSYEQQLLALREELNNQKEETKKLKTILEYRESLSARSVRQYAFYSSK